jgi:stage II sporulation protein GA (sporulation sigma-E factor processing peptidase)
LYLEIYPDIVFILNFCIDFILLFLVKTVNQKKSGLLRLCFAAMIGGCSAVVISLIPWVNSVTYLLTSAFLIKILSALIKVVTIPLMLIAAFGRMKWTDLLKQGISFFFISYFVGGFINSVYYNTRMRLYLLNLGDAMMLSNISWSFIAISMTAAALLAIGIIQLRRFYRRKEKDIYEVELSMDGRSIKTRGLFDTGNCLYDPLYHRPVIVMEQTVIEELLSKEMLAEFENAKKYLTGIGSEEAMAASLEQSEETKKILLRLRMIPYSSIGNAKGMMFGLMLDQLTVHTGKETVCCRRITAAIAENGLSPKEEYHVILHKELLYA